MFRRTTIALTLIFPIPGLAFDEACKVLLAAGEAKSSASAWHATITMDDLETEVIKADGRFYVRTENGWADAGMDLDAVEGETLAAMQRDEIQLSGCAFKGEEMVDGIAARVFTYTAKVPGSNAAPSVSTLVIGKRDNRPYRQSITAGESRQTTTYRYTGVQAPELSTAP